METAILAKLARLSRLELSAAELTAAGDQLTRLLGFFESLRDVDTDGVEPSPYPRPLTLRTRPDEPATPLPSDDVLGNTKSKRADQFLVPKVVER